ncbi:hypothetical protein PO909_005225 [Leuciscus waleckii]
MSQSSSGIPLPRTLSKHDTKSLRGPAGGRTVLSSSASSISSLSVSKDFLKGTGLRYQSSLRAQGTSGGTNRPSSAPRSAQNSPHVLKRENTYLKNTRDLRRGSLPQDGFRGMERLSNQNWRSEHHHFRSLDNEEESGQALRKPTNGNVIWETSAGIQRDFQKQRMKMQTRGDGDRGRTASKPQIGVTNTCPEGRESPRMAHVAPFRFRLPVREDTEASLEDLSDCSSDSMEMCCEDLSESLLIYSIFMNAAAASETAYSLEQVLILNK